MLGCQGSVACKQGKPLSPHCKELYALCHSSRMSSGGKAQLNVQDWTNNAIYIPPASSSDIQHNSLLRLAD